MRAPRESDKPPLPSGYTCADCVHLARCRMLGVTTAHATRCDWAPSRFVRRLGIESHFAPDADFPRDTVEVWSGG